VQGYVSDVDMYGNDECYWTSYMCLDVSLARYCVALHCAAAFVFGCLDDGGVEMPEPLDVVGLFLIFVIASTTGPVTIYRLCVCVYNAYVNFKSCPIHLTIKVNINSQKSCSTKVYFKAVLFPSSLDKNPNP
jgi:hypothetical protein